MKYLFVAGEHPSACIALIPLASALREAGHEVFMAATAETVAAVESRGVPAFSVIASPMRHFIGCDREGNAAPVPVDPVGELRFTGGWTGRMAAACLPALVGFALDWRPDVAVGGTMSHAAGLLAARLGIPYVRHLWDAGDTAEQDIGARAELREELERLGLYALPDPDLWIETRPPRLRGTPVAPAQEMRWAADGPPRTSEPWPRTRGSRPRVCVTLGTRLAPACPDVADGLLGALRTVTESLARLDVELVVEAPDAVGAALSAEFDGVRAGRFPPAAVARTCDVVVHPADPLTALTAIDAGVPQVLTPHSVRGVPMARRLAGIGAAIALPRDASDPVLVARACEEVLGAPRYARRAAELAAESEALPTPAEAVGRLEELARRVVAPKVTFPPVLDGVPSA